MARPLCAFERKYGELGAYSYDQQPQPELVPQLISVMKPVRLHTAAPIGFVYFIGYPDGDTIKIGHTTRPKHRLRMLRTMQANNPSTLKILALIICEDCNHQEVERAYHEAFAAHRLHGEWFRRCPTIIKEMKAWSIPLNPNKWPDYMHGTGLTLAEVEPTA